ncbi:hypothetical protein H5V45_03515 [Nocardioides sp. KIGAM211]|uniref:Fibronectin type-III domain-containing protein n=1 Tax=Nocardioides luti TaxID=2761101 RepID=A0A7X0VAQ9_9ACTN|nr:hypothetical protein [Nocardioides luti]MBB6626383.1 hypothetical protein [Nocardioides luti]
MRQWSGRLGALVVGLAVTLAAAGCTSDPAPRPAAGSLAVPGSGGSAKGTLELETSTVAFAPPVPPRPFRTVRSCRFAYVLQADGYDLESGRCSRSLPARAAQQVLAPGTVFYVRVARSRAGESVAPVPQPSRRRVVLVDVRGQVAQYRAIRPGPVDLVARRTSLCEATAPRAGSCPAYHLVVADHPPRPPRPPAITMRVVRHRMQAQAFRPYTGPVRPPVTRATVLRRAGADARTLGTWDVGLVHESGAVDWRSVWVVTEQRLVPDVAAGVVGGRWPYVSLTAHHPPRAGWFRGITTYDVRTGAMVVGASF